MTDPTNRLQADRSRWLTLPGDERVTAEPNVLAALPLGAVLGTDVRLGSGDQTVHLSLVKVSEGKWAVQQGRGFPVERLHGARVIRRVRRDDLPPVRQPADVTVSAVQNEPPKPNASQFRRRRERRERGRQGEGWVTAGPWECATRESLDAMPVDTRRAFELRPGVFGVLSKYDSDTWAVIPRRGIPSDALVGTWTAPRVRRDGDDVS